MSTLVTRQHARELLQEELRTIAPDADLDALEPDEDLRTAFELDSIDFLALVERLSARIGRRIEEDDYDKLSTVDSAVAFLAGS